MRCRSLPGSIIAVSLELTGIFKKTYVIGRLLIAGISIQQLLTMFQKMEKGQAELASHTYSSIFHLRHVSSKTILYSLNMRLITGAVLGFNC